MYDILFHFFFAQDGWTALMWASLRGHTDVVQKLLSNGAQVDHQDEVRHMQLLNGKDLLWNN